MAQPKEQYGAFLIFAVAVAAFGGLLLGYHTGVISGALVFLSPAFQLSIVQQGMVVSFIVIGGIFGALLGGPLADKIGRKRAIALTSLLFVIGAAIITLSHSYEIILLGRFISGLGVGMISVCAPLYLAEISPPSHRGTFVSLYQVGVTLGFLAGFVVNYVFSLSGDWRWMFAIGIFPALLQMFALFFLPETPSWLFKQGLNEDARIALTKLQKDKNWANHISEIKEAASPQKHSTWKALLSPRLRLVLFIGLFLNTFQQITGINAVFYYTPKIFETAGFDLATGAIVATLWIGIINVIATVFASWVLDKVGRRPLLLVGSAGMAISLVLLSIAFFTDSSLIDKIAVIGLMAYVASFAISLGPVPPVITSEIFPMKVRGKAMALSFFANWFFNYLVSLTFLELIHKIGSEGVFLIYGLLSALAFWVIYRFVPETKGKSLEEIETLLLR